MDISLQCDTFIYENWLTVVIIFANSIPAIRVSSDCLNCQTSVKLSLWRFSQEWVISIFGLFAQWQITAILTESFFPENSFSKKFLQKGLKWP